MAGGAAREPAPCRLVRQARHPVRISKLRCQVASLCKLEIAHCGLMTHDHLGGVRSVEVVAGGADGNFIAAGIKLGRREAELPFLIGDDADADGRARLAGTYYHAFHSALVEGRDLAGECGIRCACVGDAAESEANGQHGCRD